MAKFIRRGKAKIFWLPAVAGAVPTAAEVTAGVDLSARIADINGWMKESTKVDVPNLASRFVGNIPGEQTVGDSSLTYYADDGDADEIKTAMPEDEEGYMYLCHTGYTAGKKADLFEVRVSSVGNEYSLGNDPARFVINYAATSVPRTDITIAATT